MKRYWIRPAALFEYKPKGFPTFEIIKTDDRPLVWHKVEDELPEGEGYYLVYFLADTEYGNEATYDICWYSNYCNWSMGAFTMAEDGLIPTHWAYLPRPPKE